MFQLQLLLSFFPYKCKFVSSFFFLLALSIPKFPVQLNYKSFLGILSINKSHIPLILMSILE